jgi:DNA invertase Pin-like site-specific DNA recombinase
VKRNRNENQELFWNINILRSSLDRVHPAFKEEAAVFALHREGLSTRQIERKLGFSRTTIWRVLNNYRKRPGKKSNP